MTATTWITGPDTGVTFSADGRFDVLEGPGGWMLRENQGDSDSPDWTEIGTYGTLAGAKAGAGDRATTDPPRYSPYGDPDGHDRNGAFDGFQVTSDAEGGL